MKDVEQIEKEIGLAIIELQGLETKGKAHVKRNQDWRCLRIRKGSEGVLKAKLGNKNMLARNLRTAEMRGKKVY